MPDLNQNIAEEGKVISEAAIVEIINQCKTEIQNNNSNKVDKEEGKELSTNDFTDEDKNKLNGIENNAEVNVINSILVNGTPQSVINKNIDLIIGEGNNEYSFITASDIDRLWELAPGELTIGIWSIKTWNGLAKFEGAYIWTDGDNIYYSKSSEQYVLDKSTSTWNTITWNGLTSFYASDIWTDGDNIYYSDYSQYVLDKSTFTWNEKTWNGLTSFFGSDIWTVGDNIYYSNSSEQYVLDKSTNTWNEKTWNGLTDFSGYYIWTDGDNIYYSYPYSYDNTKQQYVLDKSTSTWNVKEWIGFTDFDGPSIWSDGKNVYCSKDSHHYKLDN